MHKFIKVAMLCRVLDLKLTNDVSEEWALNAVEGLDKADAADDYSGDKNAGTEQGSEGQA